VTGFYKTSRKSRHAEGRKSEVKVFLLKLLIFW